MKLHLPVTLYRLLTFLMLGAPSALQAAYMAPVSITIPEGFAEVPIADGNDILDYRDIDADIAFRLLDNITIEDKSTVSKDSLESESWLFTSDSVGKLRSLRFHDALGYIFETNAFLGFDTLKLLEYSDNTEEIVISESGSFSVHNVETVQINDNYGENGNYGKFRRGGFMFIDSGGKADFENINKLEFVSNDTHSAFGGAIYMKDETSLSFTNITDITFKDNWNNREWSEENQFGCRGSGGAIFSAGDLLFQDNGDISFDNNGVHAYGDFYDGMEKIMAAGGAIRCRKLTMVNNEDISFTSNVLDPSCVHPEVDGGSPLDCGGGAISAEDVIFQNNKSVLFRDNYETLGEGSAILCSNLSFTYNGHVEFAANRTYHPWYTIVIAIDDLDMSYNGSVLVSDHNYSRDAWSGVIFSSWQISINNNELVEVKDNGNLEYVFDSQKCELMNNARMFFSGNSMFSIAPREVSIGGNDSIELRDNYFEYVIYESSSEIFENGAFVLSGNEGSDFFLRMHHISSEEEQLPTDLSIRDNGVVEFSDNQFDRIIGASSCRVEILNNEHFSIDSNATIYSLITLHNGAEMEISGNRHFSLSNNTGKYGVYIDKVSTLTISDNDAVSCSGNKFGGPHPFFDVRGSLFIVQNGCVMFSGNETNDSEGCAMALVSPKELVIAGNDSVIFEKNLCTMMAASSQHYLNGIVGKGSVTLSANEGQYIEFRDSVSLVSGGSADEAIRINPDGAGGDVIITGAYIEEHLKEMKGGIAGTDSEIAASRKSQLRGDICIGGGSLRIIDGVEFTCDVITLESESKATLQLRDSEMILYTGGRVEVNKGTRLLLSGTNVMGKYGELTLRSGSTLAFELGEGNKQTPVLTYSGALTLEPSVNICITFTDVSGGSGYYKLMDVNDAPAMENWSSIEVSGQRVDADCLTWVDGVLFFNYEVPAAPTQLIWLGEPGSIWGTGAPGWNDGNVFSNGQSVVFNGSATVSLEGTVKPAAVSVSNTSGQVIFNGSGKISGTGSLTKSGAGTLEILTANDYTGDTMIQEGTVKLLNAEALGRGNVLLNGGILVNATGTAISIAKGRATLNGGSLSGDFSLEGSSGWDVKVDTAITGSMTLDNGSLTLHNTGLNISGALTLGNATLTLDGTYSQGNSYTLLSAGSIAGNVGNLTLLGVENYNLNIQDNELVLVMNATVEPDIPDTPVPPDEPELPDTPVTPDEPELPDTPVIPDEPEIPDTPVTPDEPGNPDSLKKFRPGSPVLSSKDVNEKTEVILTGKGNMTLEGKICAGAISVNTDKNLTFKIKKKRPGALSGSGKLTKRGNGTLTMNGGNGSWTGDTYLYAGTIKVKDSTSLGKGDVYVKGGTLNLGSKAVSNDIVQSGNAAIKSGKKFTGTYTLEGGELQKGATLNISRKATLEGGTVNGTLTGNGTTTVTGKVTLGDKGKITTKALTLGEDAKLTTSAKGLSSKATTLTIGEDSLFSLGGKMTVDALKINGGELKTTASKPAAMTVKNNMELTGATLTTNGKVITNRLTLSESTMSIKGAKAQNLTVKQSLTLGSGSNLRLNGKLSAGSLTIKSGGTLTMSGSKPVTLKVKGALTLNSGSSIILDYDFVQGKTYKVLIFGSYSGSSDYYSIFGVDADDCTITNTGKALTLTVTGKWNPQTQQKAVSVAAVEEPVITNAPKSATNPVADALVQANWGQLEASRAFVNAMANRSMAVQLGNGERAVWASAIGSSSRHSSAGGHAGADTNVSGGAFGLETQVGRASLFGMALGNSWTRVSAHSFGTIEQDTTHLGIYGQTNWRSGVTAAWSAAYGRSESESMGSDWSQKHLQLDGRVSYNHELNANTLLSPFAGMQYYASDSATVEGTDTGSLQNLRAEIGVAASRRMGKFGVYGEIALHQDIARNNPKVEMEGVRYTGMNPGRTGLNFTLGASYELSDKWSVNASYTGEFVENSNAHSANVGATYKF